MEMQWMGLALITAIAGAACAMASAALVRSMRRALIDKQLETDRQLSTMAATLRALQVHVEELGGTHARHAEAEAASQAIGNEAEQKRESPEPETVAVLTAAAATFMGKKARIRTAQLLPAEQSGAGTWAQQGRASVQTSHDPRSRR